MIQLMNDTLRIMHWWEFKLGHVRPCCQQNHLFVFFPTQANLGHDLPCSVEVFLNNKWNKKIKLTYSSTF